MLSNLTPRERILAIVAGSLLPLMMGLFGFMWFMRTLESYDAQISGLHSGISQAETLAIRFTKAKKRLVEYNHLSLAADPQTARTQYREWLGQLSDRAFGENRFTIESFVNATVASKVRDPAQPSRAPKTIYRELSVKLNVPSATLDQINTFLYEFYRAPILHRIATISATPIMGKPGAAGTNLPTGNIGFHIDIDALSLAEAPQEKSIDAESNRVLNRDLADYRGAIENRNIFGLPNNAPEITTGSQSEYEGRDLAFNVSARDPDAHDQLKFEIVSSNLPGASLNQREPTSKSAQLTAAQPAPGKYSVVVRATDDGFPPKSVERQIDIEIKTREAPPVVEKKPEFNHAREALISAILRNKQGIDVAWINVRTLGETFRVSVGESFELDKQQWKVTSIEGNTVGVEVNGRQNTYRIGDRLSEPQTSTTTATSSDQGSNSG